MKKILYFCSLIFLSCGSKNEVDGIFICNSETSVAYHDNKSCKGLSMCTHEIIETSKESAIGTYHKRPCKICY